MGSGDVPGRRGGKIRRAVVRSFGIRIEAILLVQGPP
jgi:hypothetical protein